MKRVLKWGGGVLLSPFLLFILLTVLLYLPPVQNWAVDKVAEIASRKTGMQISVGHVSLSFPLDLSIDDVLAVRGGDTIADLRHAVVDVKLLPLLRKQVVVDALAISDAKLNTVDIISDVQVKGQVGQLSIGAKCIDLGRGTVDIGGAQLDDASLTVLLSDTAAVDTMQTAMPWVVSVDSIVIARSHIDVHLPGDTMRVQALLTSACVTDGVADLLRGRYTVKSVDWNGGTLSYDLNYEPRVREGLDPNHLVLTSIAVGIDSLFYDAPELMLKVRTAAMREQSGLEISDVQASVLMDSLSLRLPRLALKTPYSQLRGKMEMGLGTDGTNKQPGFLLDAEASIGPQDVLLVAGWELAGLTTEQRDGVQRHWPTWPLNVRAKANGSMQHAEVEQLSLTLPTAFHIESAGSVGNMADLTTLATDLKVKAELYDPALLQAFVPAMGRDVRLPKGLRMEGDVQADGPLYAADVLLRAAQGSVKVKGQYDQKSQRYSAQVDVNRLNVNSYLPTVAVSQLTATATIKGRGTDFMQPSTRVEADAVIHRLQYDHYVLDSLQAIVRLADGHATAQLQSSNRLVDGKVTLDGLLSGRKLSATLGTELNRVDLMALGVVDEPLTVGVCGHVDVASNLKEQHYVSGFFTDLYLRDSVATFRPKDVGLLLRTTRDTTLARMQSGNLILKMDASGGYDHVLGSLSRLADTLSMQYTTRTIDQLQMRRQLPTMRLYVTSGNDNPVANFLRTSKNLDFRELLVDVTTSPRSGINGTAHIYHLNIDSTLIDTVRVNLVERANGLTFNAQATNGKRNPQLTFSALADGNLHEHGANVGLRFFDNQGHLGLRLGAKASMVEDGLYCHLIPERPTIGYKVFKLNPDNYVLLQKNMRLKAKVDLIADDGTGLKIYSEEQDSTMLQDLTVSVHQLDLGQLTEVLPFAPHITGSLNGDYHLLMDQQRQISVASDMSVHQMTYEGSQIGNVSTELVYLQREDDTHAVEGLLMLDDHEVGSVRGEYRSASAARRQGQAKTPGQVNAVLKLTHFPLSLANGFVEGQIVGLEGFAEGEMNLKGTASNLDVDGAVFLDSAALVSQPYGVRLRFDDDSVRIRDGKLLLENFNMYAYNNEPLTMQGSIDFHNLNRMTMDVRMRATNFQVVNSRQTPKSVAYGKAYVNFIASLRGRIEQLHMRGRIDVLGNTDLNYILLDSPLSTDNRLDELVKFTDFNDSIAVSVERPTPTGFDADLTLNIDQGAHVMCALNVDQTNYVDLFGGGDLRMKYNNDGISLTGRYTIGSGEMKYSLPVIPLKTFVIQNGSYVEFSGEPTNPRLNITATERTKALVAQNGGQSRSVAFDCGVVITKTLQDMGLEFIIDAPEDNSISSELNAMSVEERGKLAVTMLTTGMYLADGNTSAFSMNSALSSFLQSEINNIVSGALKTVDLSIGLDNTTDASGTMHTDYSFKFAKRFWNNRLKVQIGGKVSSGQDDAVQGQQESFFDNVTMEYRLSPTSNQYLKLFYNQNVYDWLEGYTGEYGAGYIWRRKLGTLWDIFRPSADQNDLRRVTRERQQQRTDSTQVKRHE